MCQRFGSFLEVTSYLNPLLSGATNDNICNFDGSELTKSFQKFLSSAN
jgi:hypothetical protein